jgi:hypothetical protein
MFHPYKCNKLQAASQDVRAEILIDESGASAKDLEAKSAAGVGRQQLHQRKQGGISGF